MAFAAEEKVYRRNGDGVAALVAALTVRILRGELPPGHKISEPELARELATSRGLIREAIRWLEARELVQRIPNFGPRVAVFSPRDIIEFYEVREGFEPFAARLAAQNMTDEELVFLRRHLETAARTGKGKLFEVQDDGSETPDFHSLILRGSKNERLCRMFNEHAYLLMHLWQQQYGWIARANPASESEHFRILDALENRDAECAEILMRRHLSRLRQEYAERLADVSIENQAVRGRASNVLSIATRAGDDDQS